MKGTKLMEYALLVLSLIAFLIVFIASPETTESGALDTYMVWVYILLVACIALAVGFPLVKAFTTKGGLKKLLIYLVAAVVIIGGCYVLAPGDVINVNTQATEGTFKFADAALYITYIFLCGSLVALVWGSVRNALKK